MSKITNDKPGLAQDASWLFPYGKSGRQRVNVNKTSFVVSTTGTGK